MDCNFQFLDQIQSDIIYKESIFYDINSLNKHIRRNKEFLYYWSILEALTLIMQNSKFLLRVLMFHPRLLFALRHAY